MKADGSTCHLLSHCILLGLLLYFEDRGNVFIWSTGDLQQSTQQYPAGWKVAGSRPDEVNFSIYLILPAALAPGVHSASNRNEYHKQKNNVSGEQNAAGA
jgi:hypothetical protein